MPTDQQLIDASLQGSESAFNELVIRYRERLLRFLLTRSASREDAEDAIQETFISAYRYLHSYDNRWKFSTWIYRIALRNISRQSERKGRHGGNAVDLADESADPMLVCLAESEYHNVWLTARAHLSADAFAAMWLRYVEDMTVKEVAQALDKSLSWSKVTLMRGRRKLEAELSTSALERRENYGRI